MTQQSRLSTYGGKKWPEAIASESLGRRSGSVVGKDPAPEKANAAKESAIFISNWQVRSILMLK